VALKNIPQYRYFLNDPWKKPALELIAKLAKDKKYPKILGSQVNRNKYLTALIRTQKALHGWEDFLLDTLDQIKSTGAIDTTSLIDKYPPESITKSIPAWVTYEEDKMVSGFIDELETRRIDFCGSNQEAGEFTLRFILGQLGIDWEQTILMIREMLGNNNSLGLKDLNREMCNFDYLGLFK
jgi:hypothetical protein